MIIESSPLAELVGKLEAAGCNPRHVGSRGQWSAKCPAHEDAHPSLSLRQGDDGSALVNCHAGCRTDAVLGVLGLTMADLYPGSARGRPQPRSRPRKEPRTFDIEDHTFAMVPAAIVVHACPNCLRAYAYLALRCGKENVPQRGVRAIATVMGCDPRTARRHLEHLAATGWVSYQAVTTATGAHRSSTLSLLHCPPLKILNPDVMTPSPTHHKGRGALDAPQPPYGGRVAPPLHHSANLTSATNDPPSVQPMHQVTEAVTQRMTHPLGTWYEQVGLSDEEEEVGDVTEDNLGALVEEEPDNDTPPPTDGDIDRWKAIVDEDDTVNVLLAAFPGAVLAGTRCAGCQRPVTPSSGALERGVDALCEACLAAAGEP